MSSSYFDLGGLNTRFLTFYGNTGDLFVDESLYPQTIQQALHRELTIHGYERIVFYSYADGAYFLDPRSQKLWHGRQEAPPEPDTLFPSPLLRGRLRPRPEPVTRQAFTISPAEMLSDAANRMQLRIVALESVAAIHGFEHRVMRVLQGDMQMSRHERFPQELEELGIDLARLERAEPNASHAIDLRNLANEPRERWFARVACRAPIAARVRAREHELAKAARGEQANLLENDAWLERTRRAAHARDNAIIARKVAALLNLDKRAALADKVANECRIERRFGRDAAEGLGALQKRIDVFFERMRKHGKDEVLCEELLALHARATAR